ncbi:MAG: translation elongation factor G [Deltaproteobacteria bacterium RIFOXYA12_FULL_61_11]|nr:MAG: translation elongation factor G [Deltaproteobacteria bacterium RIFOXYA12_FULL_61_11]
MAKYTSEQLRNIGLMGHAGAGKTSLGEGMLFSSGRIERLGKIDDGNTTLDYEPEEFGRHMSISTSVANCEWQKYRINILDTPGDMNFFADARCSISGMDCVILVVDAVDGVKVQSEKAWDLAREHGLPTLIFINKMEKERAKFQDVRADIQRSFEGINPLLLQVPVGEETTFSGLVDVLENKVHTVKDERGTVSKDEVPASLKDKVAEILEQAVEKIAECNDATLEKYLEQGELSPEEIQLGLRQGMADARFTPVLLGSAHKLIGVRELLDFIVAYCPNPLQRKTIKGTKPGTAEELCFETVNEAPLSGLVFKTIVDQFAGRLNLVRIFSGKTSCDATVYNQTRSQREKISNVYYLLGKKTEPVGDIVTGDIIAVAKLKGTFTGDTFCDEKQAIVLPSVKPLPGLISYAVHPKTKGDEDKIANALNRIREEDTALTISRSEVSKAMVMTGMGLVHLETVAEKIRRKFGVDMEFDTPEVPYRETMKGKIRVQGRYKKQSGGRGQFGDCWIEMEGNKRGDGFQFNDKIVGGVIPKQYIPAVEKGIVEAMINGVIAGFPVVDLKIDVVDGSYHDVDSSEMAFKIAGSMGFKKGFVAPEAKATILEPVYTMQVVIPEEYLGDIMGDITSRRGRVSGMEAKGKNQVIKAQVPLAEVLTYINDLTSMTSGKGSYTMEFSHYEEVPAVIADKLKAKYEQSRHPEE